MRNHPLERAFRLCVVASAVLLAIQGARADSDDERGFTEHSRGIPLATGQYITPRHLDGAVLQPLNPGLPAYPNFVAGEAVRSQLSPDGTTLAVLCAGQNSLYLPDGNVDTANSTQYLFLYDVKGANKTRPVLTQVIKQANAHVGLAFSPDSGTLYAAGGVDDAVYVYRRTGGAWSQSAKIALGHAGLGLGLGVQPNAGGLGLSADGKTLVVANNYNDSISVIDTATQTVRYEHDLRPYRANNEGTNGGAGGTFPFAVVVKGNGTAYVSSDRDREVVVVDISSPTAGHLVKRIKLDGNPLGMTLDAAQARLYVAQDNADQVAIIDTASNTVAAKIDARGPAHLLRGSKYTGAATFAVTLSRDGRTLYAVNSGANSVAVIPLTGHSANTVTGLIPTAYEPHDITFSADGSWMYIVNGKSVTGANPGHLYGHTELVTSVTFPGGNAAAAAAARASNQYQFQLERASLVSARVPDAHALHQLTEIVARNNFYSDDPAERGERKIEFLRNRIKHVIYIVKENRTFDQILGDLHNGANADPKLAMFGRNITPNFHRLATGFVTLDNFMDPGDGSMDGWSWALQGRVTNTETITQQINYAAVNRGLSYESEGSNRNVPVNLATVADRDHATNGAYSSGAGGLAGGPANLLAGTGDHASSDAPFGIQKGYIFNAVLEAGGTVRNYGFLVNNIGSIGTQSAPVSNPFGAGIVQVAPLDTSLAALTDLYFRGYDQNYPDLWRYNEWKREFDQFVAQGNLPSLSTVRFSHDHTGSFGTALAGVNTPETQQADDDLAVGRLVEAVAHSPYAANTLIIVTEDDCQDGPDHVDSHRATSYVVGPYVKQGAVVSTRYSQVNVLRTIEDILGTQHINLNTAYQRPMTDVFDIHASGAWTYDATASTVLKTTTLALSEPDGSVRFAQGPDVRPTHDAAYWDRVTAGFNFDEADQVPPARYNKVLWSGIKGAKPYPALPRRQTLAGTDD
ncbi:phosphoesterase [Burkholderia sp. lig30]|jgi:YVTN family beta-propeller protein|uniref:bifunctional YncE family protein/alkaline phosphatase family protein n=1 Tax=Burkholderia sp. lig30 TaxID=1192124 RepID=UPI0004620838|nr:bifunctional YncE family protein/alkaline phosphatase family protein [Burkholderia sp. lig30]KDB10291.1 phosphoesterase [Burkholderia sp. lig30]